jgi:hypothetical protein
MKHLKHSVADGYNLSAGNSGSQQDRVRGKSRATVQCTPHTQREGLPFLPTGPLNGDACACLPCFSFCNERSGWGHGTRRGVARDVTGRGGIEEGEREAWRSTVAEKSRRCGIILKITVPFQVKHVFNCASPQR